MSRLHCHPVVFLGEETGQLHDVARNLSASHKPSRRLSGMHLQRNDNTAPEPAVSIFAVPLSLKKPRVKLSVPLWVLNPGPDFESVHHLVLCQPCTACVLWLDSASGEDDIVAYAARSIRFCQRCMVPGSSPMPVYLATVQSTPASTQHGDTAVDWRRIFAAVQAKVGEDGVELCVELRGSVIVSDGTHLDELMEIMTGVAQENMALLDRGVGLASVSLLEAKLDTIRKSCSLFVVPWEEFKDTAMACVGQSEEQLKAATRATGQVVFVDRDGWLPHVIVDIGAAVEALSCLLSSMDLRQQHSQEGSVPAAAIGKVLPDLSADQLGLFLTELQDLLLAYCAGVEFQADGTETRVCMPLLASVYRHGVKWLPLQQVRGLVGFGTPCPEFFARLQVALGCRFGMGRVKHWKNSTKVSSSPAVLIACSRSCDVIVWEVAGRDSDAREVHEVMKRAVLAQCAYHMPRVRREFRDDIADDVFNLVVSQGVDAGAEDSSLERLAAELRPTRDSAVEQHGLDEAPGYSAAGDVQKCALSDADCVSAAATADIGVLLAVSAAVERTAPPPSSLVQPEPESQLDTSGSERLSPDCSGVSTRPAVHDSDQRPEPLTARGLVVFRQSQDDARDAAPSTARSSGDITASDCADGARRGEPTGEYATTAAITASTELLHSDDEDEHMQCEDSISTAPADLFLISEMDAPYKMKFERICDYLSPLAMQDRGWQALLAHMGFEDPEWALTIQHHTSQDPGRTSLILLKAVERGFALDSLFLAMRRVGNDAALKVLDSAHEDIVRRRNAAEEVRLRLPKGEEAAGRGGDGGGGEPLPHAGVMTRDSTASAAHAVHGDSRSHAAPPAYESGALELTYPDSLELREKFVLASYFRDSDAFAAKVAECCLAMRRRGICVRLDQYESREIEKRTMRVWKSDMYATADKVMLFGSPGLARACASAADSDTRYEYVHLLRDCDRLVPVLLHDVIVEPRKQCFPPSMLQPACYLLPSNERGLYNRLADLNYIPQPVVKRLDVGCRDEAGKQASGRAMRTGRQDSAPAQTWTRRAISWLPLPRH